MKYDILILIKFNISIKNILVLGTPKSAIIYLNFYL
jgi:hypothetical protein